MFKDLSLHEYMNMPNPNFPVKVNSCPKVCKGEKVFEIHWHEHLEFLYFRKGNAIIECNLTPITVTSGDLIVINSNDLHSGISLSDELIYDCIIMDPSLLYGRTMDICDAKYLNPISLNGTIFKNKVSNDIQINKCIENFLNEYNTRDLGYELALKGYLYQLLVMLLRGYVNVLLTPSQYNLRVEKLKRFNSVFKYIEDNFNENISLESICSMINMSKFHFCRQFKELTGKTLIEYVNYIRVTKALDAITHSDLSIKEIALSHGFNDLNYFSRVFKKYNKVAPSSIRKKS